MQQVRTEDAGQREVAWFFWATDIEEALGCEPGEITRDPEDDE